jgi:hypothetical protein
MPYLGYRSDETIRLGPAQLTNADRVIEQLQPQDVQDHVRMLVQMHRAGPNGRRPAQPLENMGLLSVGPPDFRALSPADQAAVNELRCALFLSCLATTVRLHGPNAGHFAFTSENFRIITQNFTVGNERISETAGVLVQQTLLGYKITEYQFPKPSYVHIPLNFDYDKRLFNQLRWLRGRSAALYRRITRAAEVFLESYYNTPTLDVTARILLQASAFEILLDLPDSKPRRHFKDAIEQHCSTSRERKYWYSFEVHETTAMESRTTVGIWADRFYTLRNHIIHGHIVKPAEYVFRDIQHHLIVAPMVFVLCAEQLINVWRVSKKKQPQLFDHLAWQSPGPEAGDADGPSGGFRLQTDNGALLSRYLRGKKAKRWAAS